MSCHLNHHENFWKDWGCIFMHSTFLRQQYNIDTTQMGLNSVPTKTNREEILKIQGPFRKQNERIVQNVCSYIYTCKIENDEGANW